MDTTEKYISALNQRLRKGFTVHSTSDGRLFYLNHISKTSSWLPPIESWESGDDNLPYGWELAKDSEGKVYYINHINKTTTYEDPRKDIDDLPPEPREVELYRDPGLGGDFGFVIGSEKPAIVRSVVPNGPCANLLLPGDEILKIYDHDVVRARNREIVDIVRSCEHSVRLTVIQPSVNNFNSTRKSAILTAAKKAKLKSHPSRVRFAEGVAINGSPFLGSTPFDSCAPFMPNVLKVFLENGQTKTFKYDATITVQDVLTSLQEKLSIQCLEYYGLCTEFSRPNRRRKLTLLDPEDNLTKIAARPGAHNLRCLFRICFVPKDISDMFNKDPLSFDYFYAQCCNDVIQERFTPEIPHEIALRLCSLHIYELALSNGLVNNRGKVNMKAFDKELGLENFVPYTLFESMKRKDLHKYINRALKDLRQNLSPPPSGHKYPTAAQAKLHFISIISELTGYGAKLFTYNLRDCPGGSGLLISPKYGIAHISPSRPGAPITLANVEDVLSVKIIKEDESVFTVEINLIGSGNYIDSSPLDFCLDEKDTEEFVLILRGYYKVFTGNQDREITISRKIDPSWWTDSEVRQGSLAPSYHGEHLVKVAPWSYVPSSEEIKGINLSLQPPGYTTSDIIPELYSYYSTNTVRRSLVDHNMNSSDANYSGRNGNDFTSLVSMEMSSVPENSPDVKEQEAIKRVIEMNRIVAEAECYLSREECSIASRGTSVDERTTEDEENTENCDQPQLKAADSLLLLTHLDDNVKNLSTSIDDTSPCESDTDVDSLIISNGSPVHDLNSLNTSKECCSNTSRPLDPNVQEIENIERNHLKHKVTIPITGNSSTSISTSFGLHSPDVVNSLSDAENDLIETLKHLQNPGEYHAPYTDSNLYLNHDIIDLTVVPPPRSPDNEESPYSIPYSHLFQSQTETSPYQSLSNETDVSLNNVYQTLAELQSSLDPNCIVGMEVLKDLPKDVDKFIATVSVPPPSSSSSVNAVDLLENKNDYLDSLIIPPPPSDSPRFHQEQDELIARFWRATDDIRKVCHGREDSSPRLSSRGLHSSSSGDSGYDSISNSNLMSAGQPSENWNLTNTTECNYRKFFLPPLKESPIDEIHKMYSHLSLDHPILLQNAVNTCQLSSPSPLSPSLSTTTAQNQVVSNKRINSCDDLYILSRKQENKRQFNSLKTKDRGLKVRKSLPRSRSWNSLHRSRSLSPHGKPPLPPNSTSRLEKKARFSTLPVKKNGYLLPPLKGKEINDLKSESKWTFDCIAPSEIPDDFILSDLNLLSIPIKTTNSCFNADDLITNPSKIEDIFVQSQRDIDTLLVRLEEVHEARLVNQGNYSCDIRKYNAAKEALIMESRHFVTASKLFVKCATEASPLMFEHLLECVSLLERMFQVGEGVVNALESQAHVSCLVDRLKEVAATYGYTVDTVQRLTDGITSQEEASASPYMGLLMNHATSLATSLSALMRTLRALN